MHLIECKICAPHNVLEFSIVICLEMQFVVLCLGNQAERVQRIYYNDRLISACA
jgi:hypothetical protein